MCGSHSSFVLVPPGVMRPFLGDFQAWLVEDNLLDCLSLDYYLYRRSKYH